MSMHFGNSVAIQWLELYTLSLLRAQVQFPVRELESPPFLFFFFFSSSTSLPTKKNAHTLNPLIPLREIFLRK